MVHGTPSGGQTCGTHLLEGLDGHSVAVEASGGGIDSHLFLPIQLKLTDRNSIAFLDPGFS